MVEEELDPVRVRLLQNGSGQGDELRNVEVESEIEVGREDGNSSSSTRIREGGRSPQPEIIPVPDPPSLSVQLPTQQPLKITLHLSDSSFDRTCGPFLDPRADGAQYAKLTWGPSRNQRSRRSYRKKESEAALKTRLITTDFDKVANRNFDKVA